MVCENYLNIIIILLLYNAIKFDYLYKIIFDITKNGKYIQSIYKIKNNFLKENFFLL